MNVAARNRCLQIASLLLAATFLILATKESIETVHAFQDHQAVEGEIGLSIDVLAHLVGACGWVVVATAFGARIDRPRLLLGGIAVGSAYIAFVVVAVLELIPILADTENGDIRAVYRWGAIGAILFAIAAAVIVAALLEDRRGPELAQRLQIGIGLVTLSFVAGTASLLSQHSYDVSHGDLSVVTIGRLATAVAEFGLALGALGFALGVRWPLARREARLAGAAVGLMSTSILFAVGEALLAIGDARSGSPTWDTLTVWMNAANFVVLAAVFAYIAFGARSAFRSAAVVPG